MTINNVSLQRCFSLSSSYLNVKKILKLKFFFDKFAERFEERFRRSYFGRTRAAGATEETEVLPFVIIFRRKSREKRNTKKKNDKKIK